MYSLGELNLSFTVLSSSALYIILCVVELHFVLLCKCSGLYSVQVKEFNSIVQFEVPKVNALFILAHAINILKWPDSLKNFRTSVH